MKKILKIIGFIFLGFIVLIIAGIIISGNEAEKERQEVIEQSAEFKVTAAQIMNEYEQNEIAADGKYEGKIVEVSGRIGDIDTDITGQPYVTLEVGEFDIFSVQCFFEYDETSLLTELRKGNFLSLKGRVDGKFGNILVKDCQMVQ